MLERFHRHLLPLRLDAMSAAYCSVRVTAKCVRPSAVQTKGSIVNALVAQVKEFMPVVRQFFDQTLPALRHLEQLLYWEWLHTQQR